MGASDKQEVNELLCHCQTAFVLKWATICLTASVLLFVSDFMGWLILWVLCRYNFKAREEEAAQLMQSTVEDVLDVFQQYLWPESKHRSRLGVHVVGKSFRQELEEPNAGVRLIKNAEQFRVGLGQYAVHAE